MADRIQKYINLVFAVLVISVLAYFVLGEILLPSDGLGRAYDVYGEYVGEWERVAPDGTREPIEVPGRCRADRNEVVAVETRLPETIGHNTYLCFRSAKQDMRFYIDGKLRQEYSTEDNRLFGRMSAAAYVFLEIGGEDAGRVLRLETRTDSSYSGIFYDVYYGNPIGVWNHLFNQFGTELFVAFITLVLSIIAIIGSIALRFCYHRRVALEYLGWGILVAAIWLITNSVFRQLIFPNLSVINDITFLMIMLLSLPFLLYMDEIQQGRYRKAYHLMEGIIIANFVACAGLHISELCDFTDTIAYVSAFCILSIILMIVTILLDLRRGRIREYPYVAVGMLGICVASVFQIIVYFQRTNLFNGVILAVGLIFLLIFATISTVHEILYMERQKQQALMASESKGRFLANMSHEIRTPINAVLGMDAMILRESKDEQIREYALDIQNAGQTLLSLINDILDISKIESGKLEILPVEYDLSSLIHDIMNMIEMKAKGKGLALHLSVDEKLPSRLWGDDVRIRQILVNLMNNAVKYTEKGSVTMAVSATVSGDTAALTFQVKDTGIGIREEDLGKLFHEFERIEEQRNRNIEGTGLGMSITTQLLERMGSRLQVESVYGEGSVFSFTLEQKIMSAEPIGNLEQRIREQAVAYSYEVMFTAPDARVLVVDDNAVNRRVFVNLLKSTKIKVDEAAGGRECLELVRKNPYDVIFLDHMMPDLDGIEVLHQMQEWEDYPCRSTPVIALTANAVTGAREMYLGEGFHNFLSKPINPEKLEKMIRGLLPEEKVILEGIKEESPGDGANHRTGDGKEKTIGMGKGNVAVEEETALPELAGIDWNYARLYSRDLEILMDTVNHFYGTIESEAAQLEQFLGLLGESAEPGEREQAFRQFRIKVHSMKNSAAMVGAVPISGVARMLEYAAADGKQAVIESITPVFLEEWRGLKEILKPCIGGGDSEHDEDKAEPDYDMTREFLRLLGEAMENMDVDTADEIMKQLKRFRYPEFIMTTVMENLGLAVAELDAEQAAVWIREFESAMSAMSMENSEWREE